MYIPHIITSNSVTVISNGVPKSINKFHPNFDKVVGILTLNTVSDIETLLDMMEPIREYKKALSNSNFYEDGQGNVFLDIEGFPFKLAHELAEEVIRIYRFQGNLAPMEAFVRNLANNPDKDVHQQLYKFIQVCGLALTVDGHFLAYKNVRDDFFDIYTGTMDNSPGNWVEMPRFAVEKNPDRTCSTGLHFAAWGYLSHYGASQKTVIVKINPADVVSIPSDYNNMKGRACRYYILKEVERPEELKYRPVFDVDEEDLEEVEDDLCDDCGYEFDSCECGNEDSLNNIPDDVLTFLRRLGYDDKTIRDMVSRHGF